MRYLSIYTPAKHTAGPPSKEHVAAMEKLVEEYTKAGVLVTTGGLSAVSKGGARVRSSGGKTSVVDGPFTESKELIAGFAIIDVKSHDEAIERTKHFLTVAGDGECELRQIMGPDGGVGFAKA
jgi:hypothetical protein